MKQVVLFGANCGKCKKVERMIRKVIQAEGIAIDFTKTEDLETMMQHQVHYLPSVMIDQKVCFKGTIPSEKEITIALID